MELRGHRRANKPQSGLFSKHYFNGRVVLGGNECMVRRDEELCRSCGLQGEGLCQEGAGDAEHRQSGPAGTFHRDHVPQDAGAGRRSGREARHQHRPLSYTSSMAALRSILETHTGAARV